MSKFVFGKLDGKSEAVAVIMAGGAGTRFWPISRKSLPKQFLRLPGVNKSLLQSTAERLRGVAGADSLLVVTSANHIGLVQEHLGDIAILGEPVARNTAPCAVYAARRVLNEVGDVPMILLPADHIISNESLFTELLKGATQVAKSEDVLVTLGIKPTRPETGYGYIRAGDQCENNANFLDVEKFEEKPNFKTAEQYFSSGDYYWNSGVFVWRPSVFLEAVSKYMPGLFRSSKALDPIFCGDQDDSEVSSLFPKFEAISVDVGVLERADNVIVCPADGLGWSDVGAWDVWAECVPDNCLDAKKNLVTAEGFCYDASNNVLHSIGDRFISVVGLDDVIVIDSEDSVLVCHKNSAQDVKHVVNMLKKQKKEELL